MPRFRLVAQAVATALVVAKVFSLPSPESSSVTIRSDSSAASTLSGAGNEGSCRYHQGGGKCPEHAPCCLNGYCSDDPRYCSFGCEPKNSWKETSCFPKAYCANIQEDFTQPRLGNIKTFNGNPNDFDFITDYNADGVIVEDSKLKIVMKLDSVPNTYGRPQGLGSVVSTTRFMQYGKVAARIKTGSISPGVVSAFIIRNEDPGDEIDFEIVGRNPTEAQTNFYYSTPPDLPTDLIDYNNTGKSALGTNTAMGFHDYEIEWMPDYILWKVDGTVIRHVFRNETKNVVDPISGKTVYDPATGLPKKRFPSTPARIQLGIWDGGQGSEGTAAWAGSPTNWSSPDQTYQVQVDSIDIQCYYSGNGTLKWPPAGYGPAPGVDGTGDTDSDGGFSENGPGLHPYVPFYKNVKLIIPVGCLLGFALVVAAAIELTRRRRLSKVRWM